jgi:hypothetical protein
MHLVRKTGLSRRRLLQSCGGLAGALPFLARTPSALAAPMDRLAVFIQSKDTLPRRVWTPGLTSGAALPASLPAYLKPLNRFRDKLSILGDLPIGDAGPRSGGHGRFQSSMTGVDSYLPPDHVCSKSVCYHHVGGGTSFDHVIARRWGQTPLVLGPATIHSYYVPGGAYVSWTKRGEWVVPQHDPLRAFRDLFGSAGGGMPDDQATAQRRSVLDAVKGLLGAEKQRLPAEDGRLLDQHLTGIRALETQLQGLAAGCSAAALNAPSGYDPKANATYPLTCRLLMDVAAQALACGTRRVVTLQFGTSGDNMTRPTWPSDGLNYDLDMHNIAHQWYDPASSGDIDLKKERRLRVEEWNAGQFAYFLGKLDGITDGGSTLLDSSLVLWTRCMGTGHKDAELFHMLAGKAGGRHKPGKFHDFYKSGRFMNDLLITCGQMVGLSDFTTFGNKARCKGPLPGVV